MDAMQCAPILIVEDDVHLRQIVQWALEDEGYSVITASDGLEALDYLGRQRPSLIVLDWGLPVLDAAGLTDRLREKGDAQVPILLITADGRAEEKARRVGATDYLHKPFDVDNLVGTVRQTLARN